MTFLVSEVGGSCRRQSGSQLSPLNLHLACSCKCMNRWSNTTRTFGKSICCVQSSLVALGKRRVATYSRTLLLFKRFHTIILHHHHHHQHHPCLPWMHPYRDKLPGPLQEGVLASCSQVPVRDQRSLPGSGVILLDEEARVRWSCRGVQWCWWPLEENRSWDCRPGAGLPKYPFEVVKSRTSLCNPAVWDAADRSLSSYSSLLFSVSRAPVFGLESFHPPWNTHGPESWTHTVTTPTTRWQHWAFPLPPPISFGWRREE